MNYALLQKLTSSLTLLMVIFCTAFTFRSLVTAGLLKAYQQNMILDSNSSDVIQLTELTYNYAMLLRQNLSAGSVL